MADSRKIIQVDIDALSGAVSTAIAQAIRQQPPTSANIEESTSGNKRR